MDRLFDSFFKDPWSLFDSGPERGPLSQWMPSLDLSEDEKQVSLALEVPGIDTDRIDISVSGNVLTIQGDKSEEKQDKGKDYYLAERRFGSFKRVVELPGNTDMDSIQAEYKNGVLHLTASKKGNGGKKKIPIFSR
jgi:HSP20 family protein